MYTAQNIAKTAHSINALLSNKSDLAPRKEVNETFSRLVALSRSSVSNHHKKKVFELLQHNGTVQQLWHTCARGEFELERYWAERICQSSNPVKALRNFPYYTNYLKLTRLEINALRQHGNVKNILFAGSGPLPLTSLIMARNYKLNITNLEIDCNACQLSLKLVEKTVLESSLPCIHSDIATFKDFSGFDVIYLAALVGLDTTEKQRILDHLYMHMQPGQRLLIRSARGLRRLLYPEIKLDDIHGFKLKKIVHPRGEVINSVIIAER